MGTLTAGRFLRGLSRLFLRVGALVCCSHLAVSRVFLMDQNTGRVRGPLCSAELENSLEFQAVVLCREAIFRPLSFPFRRAEVCRV